MSIFVIVLKAKNHIQRYDMYMNSYREFAIKKSSDLCGTRYFTSKLLLQNHSGPDQHNSSLHFEQGTMISKSLKPCQMATSWSAGALNKER